MRTVLAFLLLAIAAPFYGVAAASFDASVTNATMNSFSLTSTETTIVIANNGMFDKVVEVVCDQAWGESNLTTAFSDKYPLAATQAIRVIVPVGGLTMFIQASSTTGNIHAVCLQSLRP